MKTVVFYNECRAQNRRIIILLQGKISAQSIANAMRRLAHAMRPSQFVEWRLANPDENGNGGGWQRLWYCVEFEKPDGSGWDVWSGWWWDTEVLGVC